MQNRLSVNRQHICVVLAVMGSGSTELKQGRLPVLDQGYDLRVGLANDALSIHLHYPVPWMKYDNKSNMTPHSTPIYNSN